MPKRPEGSKSPDLSQKLTFEEAVARLGEYQTRGWRLGLDRMQEFLHRLGLDDKLGAPGGPQFIHVAGTNGKGSVCAYLQSMLHAQGHRVGATYSPYVYDVRERVQLGRDLISKEDFARLTETLLKVGATMDDTEFGGPTEFEMKTALGFLYWAEKKADWVALEVGLGGRLDATNVVDPVCSVIASIGLDHTAILGDTLALIAREKAGIIKPGRPVVVGLMPDVAREVIEDVARSSSAPTIIYGRDVEWKGDRVLTRATTYRDMTPGIKGAMQGHNLALAVAALESVGAVRDQSQLARGALAASLPGRFEVRKHNGRTFILDGAHNPEAAQHLVQTLEDEGMLRPMPLITGRLEGHEVRPFFEALSPVVERAFVAGIGFHRALPPMEVIEEAGNTLPKAQPFANVEDALQACFKGTKEGDTVLVTGSFYLVGEVGNWISRAQSPE
jgi:dihydrofolate synthase/folylpolyglutamate synthase